MCSSFDKQTDSNDAHNKYELTSFTLFDNSMIDDVCQSLLGAELKAAQDKEALDDEELFHHMRKMTRELTHLLDLPFVTLWVHITRFPIFIQFLDDYLGNMRKYNDLHKIQIDQGSVDDSRLSLLSQDDEQVQGRLRR
jgi:hypothetical protein